MNVNDVKNYLVRHIGEMEWIGDLKAEKGYYYFNVEIPKDTIINFENTIFEVVNIEHDIYTSAKLKVSEDYLDFCIRRKNKS